LNTLYQELAERIRGELNDLERISERALSSWAQAQRVIEEQDVYLDSVALNLHGFYSVLERLFELIARHIDSSLPEGNTWHRDLLNRMAYDVADIRPAVIGHHSAECLDELRRFRHLVRNVYTTNLKPEKMAGLMQALPELWPKLKSELRAFADFLEQLSQTE